MIVKRLDSLRPFWGGERDFALCHSYTIINSANSSISWSTGVLRRHWGNGADYHRYCTRIFQILYGEQQVQGRRRLDGSFEGKKLKAARAEKKNIFAVSAVSESDTCSSRCIFRLFIHASNPRVMHSYELLKFPCSNEWCIWRLTLGMIFSLPFSWGTWKLNDWGWIY